MDKPNVIVTDRKGDEDSKMTPEEVKTFTEKLEAIGTGKLRGAVFLTYETEYEGDTATANFAKSNDVSRSEMFNALCDALTLTPEHVYRLAASYETNYGN